MNIYSGRKLFYRQWINYNLPYRTFNNTPLEEYKQRVADNRITADKHQQNVAEKLDIIYKELLNYKDKRKSGRGKSIFNYGNHSSPKGLYIHGAVGGGKTMLMDMFYNLVPIKEKTRTHFNAFMLSIHSRIHELKIKSGKGATTFKDKDVYDPIPPVAQNITDESWLICFDEFQVTDIADAMILKRLFTQLFENGCVVIATSNRPPDDLYKNGLQRSNFLPFIPVLKQYCNIVQIDSGIDYRMRFAANSSGSTYFVNPQISADNIPADNLFKFLCSKENDTVRPRTLNILGREVQFDKACGGVLDSNFEELCDRPLGASDYIIIAKTFHTVFIRGIPQIKMSIHRTQLRRFITLIDTLYDNNIKVAFVAEVPANQLFIKEKDDEDQHSRVLMDDLNIKSGSEGSNASIFTGEEEMFACDRCLSRIMEMQTPAYWKSSSS